MFSGSKRSRKSYWISHNPLLDGRRTGRYPVFSISNQEGLINVDRPFIFVIKMGIVGRSGETLRS